PEGQSRHRRQDRNRDPAKRRPHRRKNPRRRRRRRERGRRGVSAEPLISGLPEIGSYDCPSRRLKSAKADLGGAPRPSLPDSIASSRQSTPPVRPAFGSKAMAPRVPTRG